MKPSTAFVLSMLAFGALSYHLSELKKMHAHGFERGWEGGKAYANGEFDSIETEDELIKRVSEFKFGK